MDSARRELSFADLRLGGRGGANSIFLQQTQFHSHYRVNSLTLENSHLREIVSND